MVWLHVGQVQPADREQKDNWVNHKEKQVGLLYLVLARLKIVGVE
jgi:hypothetical protein